MKVKKYLFSPNLSDGGTLARKVTLAFMRKAFLTDSVLFLLIDFNTESIKFFYYVTRMTIGYSCRIQFLYKGQVNIDSLIKQVDCYIVDRNSSEDDYLALAFMNGVEIVSTDAEKWGGAAALFNNLPVKPEVQQFKDIAKISFENEVLAKFPLNEYEYFLFHEGLGDSLAFLYWMKEYYKRADRKILLLTAKNSRLELLNLCPYVDVNLKISEQLWDYIFINYLEHYNIKAVTLSHYENFGLFDTDEAFMIIKNMQCFLRIPEYTPFELYPVNFPQESIDNATRLFKDMNLISGRAVFMILDGITYGNVANDYHAEFLLKLIMRLKNNGFEVIINDQRELIRGCKNIFLPLTETIIFAGLCGNVISIPTGLVEVIGSLNQKPLKIQILQPNEQDPYYKTLINNPHARIGFLCELKRYGNNFSKKRIERYKKFFNLLKSPTTKSSFYQFAQTAEGNDALIDNIYNQINTSI